MFEKFLANRFAPAVAFVTMAMVQFATLRLKQQSIAPPFAGIIWVQDDPRNLQFIELLAFLIACATVIVVGRKWPRHRDWVNVLLGLVFQFIVGGPLFIAWLFAIAVATYLAAPRLNPYVAMAATAVALLLMFRFAMPVTGPAIWISLRFISFAFEAKVARKRTFLSFLAYAPFGLFSVTQFPTLLSYLTYSTKRPQRELDAMGVSQLLLGAGKIVAMIIIYRLCAARLTSVESYLAAPLWFRIAVLPAAYFIEYAFLATISDFNTGCSNLAGYFAPAAFDSPFLASTPMDFWRRWNVHVMGFLRSTVLFPLARRKVPVALILFAALTASGLIHVFASCLAAGRGLSMQTLNESLLQNATFPLIGLLILLTIPWELRRETIKNKWPGILITQAFYAALIMGEGLSQMMQQPITTMQHAQMLRGLF